VHWPDIDEDITIENLVGGDGDLQMYQGPILSETQPPIVRSRSTPAAPETICARCSGLISFAGAKLTPASSPSEERLSPPKAAAAKQKTRRVDRRDQ